MSSISDLMSQLISIMDTRGHSVARAFKPGISREEILRRAKSLPFNLRPELHDLYAFCNGLDERVGHDDFLLGYRLLQLDEAIGHYDARMENSAANDDDYSIHWFPIMWSRSGEVKVVDCGCGETAGNIIDVDVELGNDVEFHSLETLLNTIKRCWVNGAFTVVGSSVSTNAVLYGEIGARENPGLDYWD